MHMPLLVLVQPLQVQEAASWGCCVASQARLLMPCMTQCDDMLQDLIWHDTGGDTHGPAMVFLHVALPSGYGLHRGSVAGASCEPLLHRRLRLAGCASHTLSEGAGLLLHELLLVPARRLQAEGEAASTRPARACAPYSACLTVNNY